MTGLRSYERDRGLPARAGDGDLALPEDDALVALVARHLARLGLEARPVAAHLEHARWKPGVAVSGTWRVELEGGVQRLVSLKRHRSGKVAQLAERLEQRAAAAPAASPEAGGPLGLGLVADTDAGLLLWEACADRLLPGLPRLGDPRLLARLVKDSGLFGDLRLRKRRSGLSLLRYKAERRAVLRADLALRGEAGERRRAVLGLRVLPVEDAASTAARRSAFDLAGGARLAPALRYHVPRLGLLVETWLDAQASAPDDFGHAVVAGGLLARLHGLPAPADAAHDSPVGDGPFGLAQLFRADPRVEQAHSRLLAVLPRALTGPRRSWIHGDFHPDQVALDETGRGYLLDLDLVGAGAPEYDLASWIADHLGERPDLAYDEAAGDLLAGYEAAGGAVDADALRLAVASALGARAGAALRRLEHEAVPRALEILRRAHDVALGAAGAARGPGPGPEEAPLARAVATVARLHPEAACRRVEPGRDGSLLVEVREGGLARWLQVADGEARLLEPGEDRRIPLLRAGAGRRARLLAWRPGRRVVLAFEDASGGRIVKGYRAERSAVAARRFRAAHAAGGPGAFVVPEVLEHDEALDALHLELLQGRTPLVHEHAARTWFAVGACLRRLQEALDAGDLERHGPAQELVVTDRMAERARELAGALPPGWEAVRGELEPWAEAVAPPAWAPCHRDLHDKQLLILEDGAGRLGLLDFDLLCLADPLLDAANLSVHFFVRSVQGIRRATPGGARACGDALLDGLDLVADASYWQRLRFYQATTFLRLAALYSLRPPWQRAVPDLVAYASRCTLESHGA